MDAKRYREIESGVDLSVLMRLKQIRKFLRRGKATVMVGAGFSKNAVMDEGVRMLDWGELCAGFYKELYGEAPSDRDLRFKSALRLAQQVESVKGRNALEELIKESLPNDAIAPGYLHGLLVNLKWRDIFTTNYDTLLEEASLKVYKHYNIVTSRDSLIYQQHPRIVKVHGSFPDNRPFIITEEDYRTYESKFPELVNTVRQALIETQFVLLGFSGDDPNFLNWLGWFRDIMSQRMLPVYLIHIGDMPHIAEIELMNKRGVQLIPTAACSNDVTEALDFILSYIGDVHTPIGTWSGCIAEKDSLKDVSLVDLTAEMRAVRNTFPNWLILPVYKIDEFDDCWERFPFYGSKFAGMTDARQKIEFLYEMDWRMNISFTPRWLEDEWYTQALEWATSLWSDEKMQLKSHIRDLSLSLLQIYRQTDNPKFHKLLLDIRERIKPSDFAASRKLTYEAAVWSLQHNDIAKCLEQLDNWTVTPDDYRGTLWKARLLDETGLGKQASMLIEQSISNARRKLLSNASSLFHWSALSILEDNLHAVKRERPRSKNDKFPSFIKYRDYALKEMADDNSGGYSRIHGFNIGDSTQNWNSGGMGFVRMYVGAARYFQMAEDYGRLIGQARGTFNEDSIIKASPLMATLDLHAAILYLVEANSSNAIEQTFSRKLMMSWKGSELNRVNELFDEWFDKLGINILNQDTPATHKSLNVILPMLSRLTVLADTDRQVKLAHAMIKLHGSVNVDLGKCLTTVYDSMPLDDCRKMWWHIMELPVKTGWLNSDYLRPHAIIEQWEGNDTVVENISDALISENIDVMRAGEERLNEIYSLLPENHMEYIDSLIDKRWDSLKAGITPHFLNLNTIDINNKPWGAKLLDLVKETLDQFMAIEIDKVHSSSRINDFENGLALFTNCNKMLSPGLVDSILSHSLKFIAVNRDSIAKDDSKTFFGGMRRFWQSALNVFNKFIKVVDAGKIDKGLCADVLGTINSLRHEYPFAQAIVNIILSTLSPDSTKGSERGRFRAILREGLRSDNRHIIQDAFMAVRLCHEMTDGAFGLQNVVDEVVNRLHYSHDEKSVTYLNNIPMWVKNGLIKELRTKRLAKYLKELPMMVNDNESIQYELKADLLYFGGVAAGCLVANTEDYDDVKQCLETWQVYTDKMTVPADIRKGFNYGQAIASVPKA